MLQEQKLKARNVSSHDYEDESNIDNLNVYNMKREKQYGKNYSSHPTGLLINMMLKMNMSVSIIKSLLPR